MKRELEQVSDQFPEDYLKRRILPELLKSVEFGGGGPRVFNVVLQIGSKLAEDEYEAQITPAIVRLFSSPDRAIRVCLLDNLPLMVEHLSQKIMNDKIFPNLVSKMQSHEFALAKATDVRLPASRTLRQSCGNSPLKLFSLSSASCQTARSTEISSNTSQRPPMTSSPGFAPIPQSVLERLPKTSETVYAMPTTNQGCR